MSLAMIKRPAASRDIEECFVYIAEQNLDAGVAFLVAVEESFELLSSFPLLGADLDLANEQLRGMRIWRVKGFEKYLMFYLVHDDAV